MTATTGTPRECEAEGCECVRGHGRGSRRCWGHSVAGKVWDGSAWADDVGQPCMVATTTILPC